MSHHCHAKDCEAPCKPQKLMCATHWKMVPSHLQNNVLSSYQDGQCDRKFRPSREWLKAAREAINFVAKAEGKFHENK